MMRAPLLLLSLLAACAGGDGVPPVEFGGGGARLMTGNARTPLEAYENAYAQIHRQTYNVHLNLESRGQNLFAAREAMSILVRSMETMRAMAAPFERPRFDPYVQRYQGWLKDLDRNVWGGSFLHDVDRTATEVKTKFSPAATEILVEFPDRAPAAAKTDAPAPAPPPAAKSPAAGVPSDKVELPKGDPGAPVPAPPPSGTPGAVPPAAAPSPASARIYYKAWDRAHDDLVASVKAKKDARRNYEDVIESLKLLKGQTTAPDKAKKLEIYLDYYAAVHEKTKGFTTLPEGEKVTEKDVADELDVAARVLRSLFNPDK